MRSGRFKFKQSRHSVLRVLLALVPVGLAACAQAPLQQVKDTAPRQPLAHMQVATPDAEHDLAAQLLAGEFALSGNDLKGAARAYMQAASLSNDPQVAERAVGLAVAVHDAPGAERAIARWQALGASVAGLAEARARLALDRGDSNEAREQLLKLVSSGDKDAWRVFGRILMGWRDSAQSGRLLEDLATPQRLPDDAHAWLAMSELADRLGRQAYAQTLANDALKRFHTAETYAWAAQLKYKSGDRKAALALYADAVRKAPKDTRMRLGYAGMLGQTHAYLAAGRVLARGPQDAQTYAARASFAARARDMAELKRIYEQLRQAPASVRDGSEYLLGQLAEMAGKRKQALAWYGKVDLDDDHRFDADLRSAVLLHQQGDRERAHERVQELQTEYADQAPMLRRALQVDAELYMQESSYAEAAKVYSRALRRAPDDTELLYGRGLAYAEGGHVDAAVKDLRHLLELKPGDVDAANALGYTLADNNRDLDEARSLIARARKARPNDAAIDDSWGWLQYRLGNLRQAELALRDSWKEHKDADVGAHLAEVLWKRGQSGEARKVLAEAHRLDPTNAKLQAAKKKIAP